jgi:hypothetical protein
MKRYILTGIIILLCVALSAPAQKLLFEGDFQYRSSRPSNLASWYGINIYHDDDLQYSVGSESLNSNVVTENWNANQFTIRSWARLNFAPGDGIAHFLFANQGTDSTTNNVSIRITSVGDLTFMIYDTDSTQHYVTIDITTAVIGTWHQFVVTLDLGQDTIALYTDGVLRDDTPNNALASDVIDTIEANIHFGSDNAGAGALNSIGMIQIFNRAWSAAEVTADYDSGDGTAFVAGLDTILMDTFGGEDTDQIYWHRGQKISSISTVTITVAEDVGDRSWVNGDEVVVYDDDDPANIVFTTISSASGTSIVVADTCAAVTGTNKYITKNLAVDSGFESAGVGNISVGANQTVTKDSSVVKYDGQSLKDVWAAADDNDESTIYAPTLADGNGYYTSLWIYVSAIHANSDLYWDIDGAGNILSRQLDTGSDDRGTTVALGTWLYYEQCFEADQDGAHNFNLRLTGAGAGTNSITLYVDQGEIREDMAVNPGCEGGADPPANWTQETNATVVSDTSPHTGTNCLKNTAGAANVGAKQSITLVDAKYYTIIGWAKATAGDTAEITIDTGDTSTISAGTVTATSWTQVRATFLSTGTSGVIYLRGQANGDIVWFDDIALIPLDSANASTADKGQGFWPKRNPFFIGD